MEASDLPNIVDMSPRKAVPLDGYEDDPNEVQAIISESSLSLNIHNYRNLVIHSGPDSEQMKPMQREIDNLLSTDLHNLSLQDRNAVIEEIHGVQTMAPKETPLMVSSALRELAMHIEQMPYEQKTAYLRSKELYPNSYINDRDFRLRFLRCELFDASKAASRMVDFLDMVTDLFGDYVLKRPIRITDFSWEEMQFLRRGYLQLLPYRDRSGRRIFTLVGGFGTDYPLTTRYKVLIYLLYAASDDVESQRKGIASIILPGVKYSAQKDQVKLDRIMMATRVYGLLPIRTSAIHFCLPNNPHMNIFRTAILLTMPQLRQRMKFHSGEMIEQQYTLKGYGIPVELIPLTDTGNIKTAYLKQWIKLRKNLEGLNENRGISEVSIIECPGSNDVVFRPGTSVSCHPGNVQFRCLLESITSPEETSLKITQAQMAEKLINEIESVGGRFLKWDSQGHWSAMHNKMNIHTKVALSIRDFKYKTKAQRLNRQNNQSYTYLFCQDGRKRNREEGNIGDQMNRGKEVKIEQSTNFDC